MLKIEAIVRSSVLYELQDALIKDGIQTFSTYQVQITGLHKSHQGWRNKTSSFIPKTKIEILCSDKDGDHIIKIIQENASTGEKGDGIVFSYSLNKLVKIKDGKTGSEAL